MLTAHKFMLAPQEQYPLPPERITERVAERVGLDSVAHDKTLRREASLVNHFLYGAAAGTLYAPLLQVPAPPVLKGIGLGVFVWSGSYLGMLPALGILSSATHHPARRNTLMIIAHFIWGSTTALLAERQRRK